jgi:hypothetical protein
LFCSFFSHVVLSLTYPNLFGNKILGCCCTVAILNSYILHLFSNNNKSKLKIELNGYPRDKDL